MWTKSFKRILLSSIAVSFFSPVTFAGMLEDWLRFAQNPGQGLSYQHRAQVNEYQYIFVGGYMNEVARANYFKINAATTEDLGAADVKIYFPSSANSARTSAIELRNLAYREYKASGGKSIIFISHSMAGLSMTGAVLLDPELITKGIVKKVIAFQSPLTGNDLADQQGLFKQFLTIPLNVSNGFYSLQTKPIKELIENRIAALPPELRKVLSDSISYVISKHDIKTASPALQIGSFFLPYKGDYDGLVARQNMWIPDFGTILGDVPADHLELVLGDGVLLGRKYNEALIRAFTKSLIVNILKSINNPSEYRKLTKAISCQKAADTGF